MINVQFTKSARRGASKQFGLVLEEDKAFENPIPGQAQCLIMAAISFGEEQFTLEELAVRAVEEHGLVTKQEPVTIARYYSKLLQDEGVIGHS